MADQELTQQILKQLPELKAAQINATLEMLGEGDTVPFIARYRKERTQNLDEVQIRSIMDTANQIQALNKRRSDILKRIEEQGALTPKLQQAINAADKMQQLENLYLPYKQKRRTKATIAKELGLAPIAEAVFKFAPQLDSQINQMINHSPELPDREAVLAGVHEILAETISEHAQFRDWILTATQKNGNLVVKVKKGGKEKDEEGKYEQYYDFNQRLKAIPGFRTLAINRGEKEGILTVKVEANTDEIINYLQFKLIQKRSGLAAELLNDAIDAAYKRFIGPAIEREIRNELTEAAETHAITVFGENLYHLLMQAPLKGKIVMGFDPAYRTGCKLAIMDANGKFLAKQVIYPHKPAATSKREAAMPTFIDLLEKYQVEMIAIGNGTASRESEQFVAEALKKIKRPIYYVITNEAGASVYSASQVARDEFPDFNVEERSAVSIGRRIQDPLAELVKIDPQAIGVGQYQHDVAQKQLTAQLDQVVETAVNQVGVNVNTASPELLIHISGLTKTTAQNIVKFRNENGPFASRKNLAKVPRLGPKAYEQSVGFLRIIGGKSPLDNTDIHPESYPQTMALLQELGFTEADLGTEELKAKLSQIEIATVSQKLAIGEQTLTDIIASLQHPGRDLRDEMPAPLLRQDVLTMADLKPGMQLQGTVRNVVDFGVFVDIGVKHDGLVHISKMSNHYVSSPAKLASVGDIVTVWIDSVDEKRNRIQLTMVAPE
ncbi:Tex-like protein [Lentilactobacillus senioris DSM 24302 = JCM 17472]|uniref:Tex-like protein n=1 Tax=Lentilactobacillus senioris DSM 24302 = JCM 17472 TaxID=1423802 RepID=A0A0R2D0B2_9LACO|nr:Tex family protein [Lentilactobacillus senioris]KRM93388.1 Tex-like protein [Lentilactobacillus senioris DSM 24302 = JCM 17472]